jgi:putative ABC transport system permease protein
LRLIPYHTRLAIKSLRRDRGLSATIVIVLAVASAIFSMAIMHYLRTYGPRPALSPALHQVEIGADDRSLRIAFAGATAGPTLLAAHTRVSFPNYKVLASSGIPARQTATFHSRLWIGRGPRDPDACSRNGRFVNADFFAMFAQAFRYGAPFTRDDEAAGRRVVVVGRQLNQQLYGGQDSTGRTLMVDGRSFAIAGVLADDQPFTPDWDPTAGGFGQDAAYIPFDQQRLLRAWPEATLFQTPIGPHHADLLASDAVFVAFWLELPTVTDRRDYQQFLDQRFGGGGVPYRLRDLAAWRAMVRLPPNVISFFTLLTVIILAGSGLIVARLLMAKGLVRGDELGVFRALGAPRGALFWRQIIEATILSAIAASISAIIALPEAELHNHLVHDTDIPLRLTGLGVLIIFGATMTVGVGAALFPSWWTARRRPTLILGRS